jgi:hypothetical protein
VRAEFAKFHEEQDLDRIDDVIQPYRVASACTRDAPLKKCSNPGNYVRENATEAAQRYGLKLCTWPSVWRRTIAAKYDD